MIKSFIHKGLKRFYQTGSTSGIQSNHKSKLRLILTNLDQSEKPKDMDLPGLDLHQLTGDKKEIWSVKVNGNWRVTFKFIDNEPEVVNYEDYH
jgi:toxin HigB-1